MESSDVKMTARPYAYIRRSARSRTDPGDISREFQTDKVRQLAGADAPFLVILDGDWGKSAATDKTDKRLAFLGLMESVERGDVRAAYAYSLDRLARSVEWSSRFLNACERASVPIITSEGRFDPSDDMARNNYHFQAITNESYSRQAVSKRKATVERLRARGDKMGPPFYGGRPGEDVDAVVRAYRETGSLGEAARRLNREGVPTRVRERRKPDGTTVRVTWTHSSVRQILARMGLVPRLTVRGAKPHAPHPFYRLLRCHCGRVLSPAVRPADKSGHRATIYRCVGGATDPTHGKLSVSEGVILPWAKAEAAHLGFDGDVIRLAEASIAERTTLTAKRDRVIDMYANDLIDKEDRDRRLAAINADLLKLDDAASLTAVPTIEWDDDPRSLNDVLRDLWSDILLGPDMRPVEAIWRVPELRRP